jgi:hypothetical protein
MDHIIGTSKHNIPVSSTFELVPHGGSASDGTGGPTFAAPGGAGRSHGGGSRTLKARFEGVYPTLVGTAGCPGDVGFRRAELLAAECEARDLVPRQTRSRIIRAFTNAKRRSLLRASDGSAKPYSAISMNAPHGGPRGSCRRPLRAERSVVSVCDAPLASSRRAGVHRQPGLRGWRIALVPGGTPTASDATRESSSDAKRPSSPRSSPHSRRLGSSGWLIA